MRKLNGYVEEKLKNALDKQLEELEEKSKIAEQARAYFGEDMYKKLMEIEGSRNEALMFDQGNVINIPIKTAFLITSLLLVESDSLEFLFHQSFIGLYL